MLLFLFAWPLAKKRGLGVLGWQRKLAGPDDFNSDTGSKTEDTLVIGIDGFSTFGAGDGHYLTVKPSP